MLVVYDSLTGNVKKFVKKLPSHINICHIDEYKGNEKFVFVTYTFKRGDIPDSSSDFLTQYQDKILAVSSSGNKIWGDNFANAANKISYQYNVPIINKFELHGTNRDVENFEQGVKLWLKNGPN